MANSKLGISLLMSGLGIVWSRIITGLFYAPSVSSNEWNAPLRLIELFFGMFLPHGLVF